MIPYACPVCHLFDEKGIGGHATNRCNPVANAATNAIKDATNNVDSIGGGSDVRTNAVGSSAISVGAISRTSKVPEVEPAPAKEARTSNRRDRSAYNAYQREYMKKRRAAA